jgi:hypothetical protein
MTLLRSEFIAMMSMKFCKASGTTAMDLDAVEAIAVAGVPMEPGVRFSRGQLHSGIDVAEYLDGLAINYPRSVQGVITGGASKAHARSAVLPAPYVAP